MLSRARLISGLILMAFATTHLINHAFGLASLEAMTNANRSWLGFWHIEPLNVTLLLALIVHIGTSMASILKRKNITMPWWQWGQIVSGILIPFLLCGHIIGTAMIQARHGFTVDHLFVMPNLWPGLAGKQIVMSLLIWGHGAAGIHFWLRQKPFYRRVQPWLIAIAVLIPALSMAGFVAGGKDMASRFALDPGLRSSWAQMNDWPSRSELAWTLDTDSRVQTIFALILLGSAGWWVIREYWGRWQNKILVTYEDGTEVRVPATTSILEASLIGGVPHASVCGGRGRCSTCRVRVLCDDGRELPPANPQEAKVLQRLGGMADVRLACQLRLEAPVQVTRLMSPSSGPADALRPMDPGLGIEREIVVLFADLRSFTQLSESRLPFDVVHLLNRYFDIMGSAIEHHGGHVDKFIGDGIMALFGIHSSPSEAAANALCAARAMGQGLEQLNGEMASDLAEPLHMGIGLHLGPAIVGEMGYGRAVNLTAIGDTVNTASPS